MKTLTIERLRIADFKGIKADEIAFNGRNATLRGKNGTTKTTFNDAHLWLWTGKDSTGREQFGIHPTDKNNNIIPNVLTEVEETINFDGKRHVLKKQLHEKVKKGEIVGYDTQCYIDEVTKKVGEFSEFLESLIPSEVFKMVSNPRYFLADEKTGGIHHTKRRTILLDMAGEIGTPEGFDALLASADGRDLKDYKQVLLTRKKKLETDQAGTSTRINENQRTLDQYAGQEEELSDNRQAIRDAIRRLDDQRLTLVGAERERQEKIDAVNDLKVKLARRESELQNDVSAVKSFYDEKAKLTKALNEKQQECVNVGSQVRIAERGLESSRAELDSLLTQRQQVGADYTALSTADFSGETCKACGQVLPADKIENLKKKNALELEAVTKKGFDLKAKIDKAKATIEASQANIAGLKQKLSTLETEYNQGVKYNESRFKILDQCIENRPAVDCTKDEKWQQIQAEIQRQQKLIGEPASAQLETIEAERRAKQEELTAADARFAQADTIKKAEARIKELEAEELKIAQQLADVEKELADIDAYYRRESEMIEAAVNGKFKHLSFRLFKPLMNGGSDPCCDALYKGIQYPDMSTGEKLFSGLDAINALSEHYGIMVPVFIDNAESLTLPIELKGQYIRLFADEKKSKLEIKIDAEKKQTAAA